MYTNSSSPQPFPGEVIPPDHTGIRRLFMRDARAKQATFHRLAVIANHRNSAVKLCHVIDSARISVHRTWNLSELRRIDGLGAPVAESICFALFFNTPRPSTFQTSSPEERAKFLWSLLQTCASKFRRAPPVVNLSLLDLQNIAEGGNRKPQVSPTKHDANPSPNSSTAEAPMPDIRRQLSDLSASRVASTHTTSSLVSRDDGLQTLVPRIKVQGKPRAQSNIRSETRSLTEIRSTAAPSTPTNFAEEESSGKVEKKGMSIDDRAFLAAANQLGANVSFGLRMDLMDKISSVGSDPKARLFQNLRTGADVNTFKLMEERLLQQEKKKFRLDQPQQDDLEFALQLFKKDNSANLLHEFGNWANAQIRDLEVDNISDLVDVERGAPAQQSQPEGGSSTKTSLETTAQSDHVLTESVVFARKWLEKCETILAPYATLAKDINHDIKLLDCQRCNANLLQNELDEVALPKESGS